MSDHKEPMTTKIAALRMAPLVMALNKQLGFSIGPFGRGVVAAMEHSRNQLAGQILLIRLMWV